MKLATKTAAALAALALAATLTACSSDPEVADPNTDTLTPADPDSPLGVLVADFQSSVPDLIAQFDGTYSDIRVLTDGNDTLVYEYVYADQVDGAYAEEVLSGQVDILESTCNTDVLPALASAGVENAKARYTYYNADDTLIWTHLCEG